MQKIKTAIGKYLIASICLFFSVAAAAQNGNVKGTVKNSAGANLQGASITVEGKSKGTATDVMGNYLLQLPAGTYTIVASYVGQATQKVKVTVTAGGTVMQNFDLTEAVEETEITVVGSRRPVQRSNIATAVPVDVVSMKEIKNFAQADVTQMLTYVAPSFQSARQTIADGTDHIDPAGLRGLGPDQTLMLLNGKRRHNTALVNINGTVGRGSVGTDLNAIPAVAIERIEVLRDGAAAQFGSDAIAGVINVVLKKRFKGLNISAMSGQNFTNMPYNGGIKINDGLNQQVDAVGGISTDKFYVTGSLQWLKRDMTNRSGNDLIPLVYLGNGGAFPNPPTGVATDVWRRWLIDQDKTIVATRRYNTQNIVAGNSANNNLTGFVNAGYKLGANTELYLTSGGGRRTGQASGFSRNPNSMNQQPVLADGTRFYADGFLPEIHTTLTDYSLMTGLKTKLGAWTIDMSNTYGYNSMAFDIKNTGNASLPASNNVQTQFKGGKIAFTQNVINVDASRSYNLKNGGNFSVAFGLENRYEQYQIFAGEPNSYRHGGRNFATASITYIPTGQVVAGTTGITAAGAQVFPGFQPSDAVNAKRNIHSGYADFEYSKDKLIIGAAIRGEAYAEELGRWYNGTGTKLSARYEFSKNLAVRGSFNTGFRAPSLQQRYFQNQSTQFVAGLPTTVLTANNANDLVKNAFGIDDLRPEKSTSFTFGLVGKLDKKTTFTIDAYSINIDNRIVLSTQFARSSSNPRVGAVMAGLPADVSSVQFWTNAVNTKTQGIDVVVTRMYKLGKGSGTISLAGNFNDNKVVGGLNTNAVINLPINNPSESDATRDPSQDFKNLLFDRQQRSRIEVAQPRTKFNLTANYNLNKFNFMLRAVRFGEVQLINLADPNAKNGTTGVFFNDVDPNVDQTFSAKIVTDLVVTYRFYKSSTVSVGANNLFDIYPDRLFQSPLNDPAAVYANPVQSTLGTSKTTGGFNAARDLTNRGRFLFPVNQFGFNGRFMFVRLSLEMGDFFKSK